MSWFTKYRPTSVSELHLKSVREELSRLMESGSFPRSLLFAGPKGTGKTSSARIIGAMLNDEANSKIVDYIFFGKDKPSKTQLSEPDANSDLAEKIFKGHSYIVNEMDAASNRGIDDVRQLKERINLPPQEGKIAVYILDEVHMLTTEAFNALLKVLEEPPAHVVFILATTERHKLPETIISRCSEVSFHKASVDEITESLVSVLEKEKIKYDIQALTEIASMADGSFRDGVKLLQNLVAGKEELTLLDTQTMSNSFGVSMSDLIDSLLAKDERLVVTHFETLRSVNTQSKYFYKSLMEYLHQQLMISLDIVEGESKYTTKVLNFLLSNFNQIEFNPNCPIELLDLELKFLELVFRSKDKTSPKGSSEQKKNSPTKVMACEAVIDEKIEEIDQSLPAPIVRIVEVPENLGQEVEIDVPATVVIPEVVASSGKKGSGQRLIDCWSDFLASLKNENISLELLLRSARPVLANNDHVTIEVFYSFHQEQLQQPKFLSQILKCMHPIAGGDVSLNFVVAKSPKQGVEDFIKADDEGELVMLAKEALV